MARLNLESSKSRPPTRARTAPVRGAIATNAPWRYGEVAANASPARLALVGNFHCHVVRVYGPERAPAPPLGPLPHASPGAAFPFTPSFGGSIERFAVR